VAFLPYSVGGTLASRPPIEKTANKKAHAICKGLIVCWLPVLDEFRNFLASGEGAIVVEQIKQFNLDFGVLDGVLPDALASGERVERTTANGLKVPSIGSRAASPR